MSWLIFGTEESKELQEGIKVEMEHAETIKWLIGQVKNGRNDDKDLEREAAAKIAEDHLKEFSDYYSRLAKMEGGHDTKATEDIEMRFENWTKTNPDKKVIGRDVSGIWWNDATGSTHLMSWEDLKKSPYDQPT